MKTIAVFCASARGAQECYREAAAELGASLAGRGLNIVYGGGRVGLMQAVADASLAEGGRVVGVIPEVLMKMEVGHTGCTELHVVDTMHTRKAKMAELADAFVVLPGGFGTLEEVFEVLTWQTLRLHAKPIVLVNTNGFYDKLLGFLDHAVEQGMLKPVAREVVKVADTVDDVMRLLEL